MAMRTLDFARELLAKRVDPLPGVELKLADAVGHRLAQSPRADIDLPAADVSTMDGYAACAEDLTSGLALPVAFEVPAGQAPPSLPRGSVARVFTGTVIPARADVVVPQEQAEPQSNGTVRLASLEEEDFIRRKGELCCAATPLAEPGDLITPQLVALLGVAGASTVRVTPRPRVAVLSTGSELVPIAERPGPGEVRDSNGAMLVALANTAGFEVTLIARVADETRALHDAFEQALAKADLIVTSGGVSVGDYDLVPNVLDNLGAETVFHRLAIKPGKPLLTARLGGAWVVGLPGNPVSALVGWRMFARPLGEMLAGNARAFAETPEPAVLTKPTRNPGDRTILAPAWFRRAHPAPEVTILPWKGSHDVVTVARANALAIGDVGAELAAGDVVHCYQLY